MAKIIEEEDASSDINSDNYNNNNDSYSFNYHYNNSKSQDIRIKNLASIMMKNNIEDTPPKKIQKRPRLKSMTTPISTHWRRKTILVLVWPTKTKSSSVWKAMNMWPLRPLPPPSIPIPPKTWCLWRGKASGKWRFSMSWDNLWMSLKQKDQGRCILV